MSIEPIDFEKLTTALTKFFNANAPEEHLAILQQHPELLSEEVDKVLEQFIHHACEQGNEEFVQLFSTHREMLQNIRQVLVEGQNNENDDIPPQFRADFNQAQAAEARYELLNSGVSALDEAITAWERILNHAEFACVDEVFRLVVLNDSARTYLRRYWAKGALDDLDRALSRLDALVKSVPTDLPYLPVILSNLGSSFSGRYARIGEFNDLQEAITAHQRAVDLTPNNSPSLPGRLNNLGNDLYSRYVRLGEPNDLQAAIESYRQGTKNGLKVALEN